MGRSWAEVKSSSVRIGFNFRGWGSVKLDSLWLILGVYSYASVVERYQKPDVQPECVLNETTTTRCKVHCLEGIFQTPTRGFVLRFLHRFIKNVHKLNSVQPLESKRF